jgi:hypothetical protein
MENQSSVVCHSLYIFRPEDEGTIEDRFFEELQVAYTSMNLDKKTLEQAIAWQRRREGEEEEDRWQVLMVLPNS